MKAALVFVALFMMLTVNASPLHFHRLVRHRVGLPLGLRYELRRNVYPWNRDYYLGEFEDDTPYYPYDDYYLDDPYDRYYEVDERVLEELEDDEYPYEYYDEYYDELEEELLERERLAERYNRLFL